MRFNVPEGYSTVFQGQIVKSKGGVIDTDNKALIEQLSRNPNVRAEKPRRTAPKPE